MASNIIKLKDLKTGGQVYPITTTSAVVDSNGDSIKYAGSSSAGGSATSSVKLATARKIDGVEFNGTADISHLGSCSTESNVSNKVVSLSGYKLVPGSKVMVYFTNGNTSGNVTINVNGTGAKSLTRHGSVVTDSRVSRIGEGEVIELIYTGSAYEVLSMNGLSDWSYI